MRAILISVGLVLTITTNLFAWSTKEHIQLTRMAIERLIDDPATPADAKQWLKQILPQPLDLEAERQWFMNERQGAIPRGVDGVAYWCVMPDMNALMDPNGRDKIEPFGVAERPLHYIDLELFVTGSQKREYKHDLSGKPKLQDIPRDMKDPRWIQAGMLPFRVVDCYNKLVTQLRAHHYNDKLGQYPKDEHSAHWAGFLAHYCEDNTQPQHATIDYKSSAYFANKRKAPNVHAQVEYELADDADDDHMTLRQEYWPAFVKALGDVNDTTDLADLWKATCETSLASYDALPMIGVAAMAATKQGGTPDHPQGDTGQKFSTETFYHAKGTYMGREMTVLEMKAYQQAWAVKRVQRVLLKAWDDAHQPIAAK